MDKKYQVFISSTYLDMKEERQTAVEAILDAGHIPAGMELFAASDKQQIEVIKGWIDKSDIFMLILGGRYGSVEQDSGKSYIQLEYEYAVQSGKPFFALYLTEDAINAKVKRLGTEAIERHDTRKLNEFRALVKSKLCSEIEDLKDIKIQVPKAIRELSAANKLEGWVRASNVPNIEPLMAQLATLQAENGRLHGFSDHLKTELARVAEENSRRSRPLAQFTGDFSESNLDTSLDLEISVDMPGQYRSDRRVWKSTYRVVFSLIGAKLLEEPSDKAVHLYINKLLKDQTHGSISVAASELSFQAMKMKLVSFGVVELTKPDAAIRWTLTENGQALLKKIHAEA